MSYFIVNGGRSLKGELRPAGNKNEALPVLASCILTEDTVLIRNLPDIKDVNVMLEILKDLGASVNKKALTNSKSMHPR